MKTYRHPGEIGEVRSTPHAAAMSGGHGGPPQWGLVETAVTSCPEIPLKRSPCPPDRASDVRGTSEPLNFAGMTGESR